MSIKKQSKPKNTTINQTNEVLDSIPQKIISEVRKCAREGKNMWFIGGNDEQKKALFNYAHSERYNPERFNLNKKRNSTNIQITQSDIDYLAPSRILDFISLEGFGKVVLIKDTEAKERVIIREFDSYLSPSKYALTDERDKYVSVKTIFINNIIGVFSNNGLTDFGSIILTKLDALRKKLENHPEDSFNEIIIVNFCEKVPDNYQVKFKEQFALVSLDGEAKEKKTEDKQPGGDLFMDDQKNALYIDIDKKKIVTLKPEEIKLIKYMSKHDVFELEQILTDHFEIKLTGTYKPSKTIGNILPKNQTKPPIEEQSKAISKGERNIFDTYKSQINKKCQLFGIGDLIVKQGDVKKAFRLSVKITKKLYSYNVT